MACSKLWGFNSSDFPATCAASGANVRAKRIAAVPFVVMIGRVRRWRLGIKGMGRGTKDRVVGRSSGGGGNGLWLWLRGDEDAAGEDEERFPKIAHI